MTEYIVEKVPTFHWVDYIIFGIFIFVPAAIGVFFGFLKKQSENKTDEFLLGGRRMDPLPVAMSCWASIIGAPAIIGIPTEIYLYGTMRSWITVGMALAALVNYKLLIPVFHRLNITSANEYLELRFNKVIRGMASSIFVLQMVIIMAVVTYVPAATFNQVTGLSQLITILGIGIICTFYTTVGGMKAVIWTDVLQMCIILISLLILGVKGTVDTGGINVWNRALDGGRMEWDVIDAKLETRHTVWTQIIGGTVLHLAVQGTNQTTVQRILSVKSLNDSKWTTIYATIIVVTFQLLVTFVGLVAYAYYYNCDPIITQRIPTPDQLVPLFTMDVMGNIHGLPGLFTAAVFSGTLSSVSSGVNALAAVILIDIIRPLYHYKYSMIMNDKTSIYISKAIALLFGICTIGLSYLTPYFGNIVIQITSSLYGMIGGPMLGLFTLGICFPWTNSWGAGAGFLSGLLISFWIAIGATLYMPTAEIKSLKADMCAMTNISYSTEISPITSDVMETTLDYVPNDEGFHVTDLYRLSYMWYAILSLLVVVSVGLAVSLCTGPRKYSDTDPKLLMTYVTQCRSCFNICQCKKCCFDEDEISKGAKISIVKEIKRMHRATSTGYSEDEINNAEMVYNMNTDRDGNIDVQIKNDHFESTKL